MKVKEGELYSFNSAEATDECSRSTLDISLRFHRLADFDGKTAPDEEVGLTINSILSSCDVRLAGEP